MRLVFSGAPETIPAADGAAVLEGAGLPKTPEIDAGSRETWTGLCLPIPGPRVDRVRLEMSLSTRKGLKRERREQAFELTLRRVEDPLVLDLPVAGAWRVSQGHDGTTQHRRGRLGGEFAWDLAAVTDHGSGARYAETRRNADSPSFGREVVSPSAGTVVSSVDGVADNDEQREFPRKSIVEIAREPAWIFGNHVVIDAGGGRFVLLAHLMRGSVAVKAGDAIARGALLGRVGNSGNTMLPHLHLQVMDRKDPADEEVSGLPALFRDYVEITARGTTTLRDAAVRRVAAGDPPQDAIVMRPEER